jgi:hypothetical protein
LWIAASVKARDHDKDVNFCSEKESVRKFTQTRTMHISKNRRELVRILLQTQDGSLNFFEKASPETALPGLVPILSVQKFGARSWRKDYLHRYGRRLANSARNCSQVTA